MAGLLLSCVLLWNVAPGGVHADLSLPPGAPAEDEQFANEWPSPNGDLYNTRVAHSLISSTNVAQLGVAWTMPMQGNGVGTGFDVANPLLADGVAYLQDGASNVTAVRYATGEVLWTHEYDSPSNGPNGVTIADGKIYGVTTPGVFALAAQSGDEVWYRTDLGASAKFDIPPQVADGKVFVSSAVTVGGGQVYALDAKTGATLWSFQTVIDPIGQHLVAPAGGAWDAFLIGQDQSVYVGVGNAYLSQQDAETTPSQELYTDSLVKLSRSAGALQWYYQVTPNDFHDWDLQISPIYTYAAGRAVVLAAGKAGFVLAVDPSTGQLLWRTSVGMHNGHDDDGQRAIDGQLQLPTPYVAYPGEVGGVQTNMAAADGVVYVPVVNSGTTFANPDARVGTPQLQGASGEMVAIDITTGQPLWTTQLPQMPLGGATISTDLVFTTTLNGQIFALSRADGSIVWTTQLPAGSNATLAIAGSTLIAGAGLPLDKTQQPVVVAYQLGAGQTNETPPAQVPTK